MSNSENSGPAFPCETVGADEHGEYRLPWQGMTLRQYAAIKLRVPNSGTDWLDEMIRTSLRDEFAAKAMSSLVSGGAPRTVEKDERDLSFSQWVAKNAHEFADAMCAARGEEK